MIGARLAQHCAGIVPKREVSGVFYSLRTLVMQVMLLDLFVSGIPI